MIVGIIPARYDAQRFPGKVLAQLDGRTMIQHVYERAMACEQLDQVMVATDDERVLRAVVSFGGKCLMTSSEHRNGTERCAEVARLIPADHYVNIQGDEPLIAPSQIDSVCTLMAAGADIATLRKRITTPAEINDPNIVKVVTSTTGSALYFSRSPIPFARNAEGVNYFRHIGIYGFRGATLQTVVNLAPTTLEEAESLEQLRWLENGLQIKVAETTIGSQGVDTQADLDRIQTLLNERENP